MENKNRFVWHDLKARDVEAEKRFYGELFGWTFEKSDDGRYEHIKAGDELIGGLHKVDGNGALPTHWLGYVAVDDVKATLNRMASQQGKVHRPLTEVENVGTFAVVEDPTGATLAPWKTAHPEEEQERAGDAAPNTFFWDELVTQDIEAAERFYTDVFGWTAQHMPEQEYVVLNRPGTTSSKGQPKGAGGMVKADGPEEHEWIPYVSVQDPDAVAARAEELGARVQVPPTDIPNVGRYSVFTDPQGAHFAVMKPAPM